MAQNEFVDAILSKLDGKLADSDLNTVLWEVSAILRDWDVSRRSTALAVYTGLPLPYKAFMVTKRMEGRSDSTLELYKGVLEDMLQTIGKPIEDISTNDVRFYLLHIKETNKISLRTLDSKRLILNSFFSWCNQEGYITRNPCASISPIKFESKPREAMTDVQMELLRDVCLDYREKALLEVLYSTGCRCAELVNLKISDVDLVTREVKLFGKGKKHRVSYINARAEIFLKRYLASRCDSSLYLFVSTRKPVHPLSNSGVEKIIHDIGVRAGMDDVYPHKLRHTFATHALNRGMNVAELQKLLGHASLDTTMIYAKISTATLGSSHARVII